jgi:hypothetical protein
MQHVSGHLQHVWRLFSRDFNGASRLADCYWHPLSWLRGTNEGDGAKGSSKSVADKLLYLFRTLVVAEVHVALSNLRNKSQVG